MIEAFSWRKVGANKKGASEREGGGDMDVITCVRGAAGEGGSHTAGEEAATRSICGWTRSPLQREKKGEREGRDPLVGRHVVTIDGQHALTARL